ncbi:hypothetical protein HK097_004116 [Rhizophlyctis rosea]|uniref:aromatase n=1 Tax=Rhizophlyctis rosea TaxID=64517 RepID=A0AAD5SG96_9FUNG|nr:hypothetical protein HK097_004116 [Rhizophlyctis rosea]
MTRQNGSRIANFFKTVGIPALFFIAISMMIDVLSSGLNDKGLEHVAVVAEEATDRAIEKFLLNNGPELDVLNFLRHITLDVTVTVAFGLNVFDLDAQDLIDAIVDYFHAWEFFLLRPTWSVWLFPTKAAKQRRAIKRLQEHVHRIIAMKRQQDTGRDDFLRKLLSPGAKLTEQQISQCVLEMLLAGTDTSSVTMYYTLLLLSENPGDEKKMIKDLTEYRGRFNMTAPYYATAVFSESMRIKPVGPVALRRAAEDDKLGPYDIKAGTWVIVNMARIHGREDLFREPKKFDPARFLMDLDNVKSVFFPFGTGPKSCVGSHMAHVEMKAIFKTLLPRFRFKPHNVHSTLADTETRWDIAQQPTESTMMWVTPRDLSIRHVLFTGPQSVGKTTLCNMLQSILSCSAIQEVAREVMPVLNVNRNDIINDPAASGRLQQAILQAQQARESELSETFYVSDRCGVDPIVYCRQFAEAYAGALEGSQTWLEMVERYRFDEKVLVVLISPMPTKTLVDDGVRAMPTGVAQWLESANGWKDVLDGYGIPYVVLKEKELNRRVIEVLKLFTVKA